MTKVTQPQTKPTEEGSLNNYLVNHYLEVAPQHAVELGNIMPFMVPREVAGRLSAEQLLVPMQLPTTDTVKPIICGGRRRVLIGMMSKEWLGTLCFYVPPLAVLEQLQHGTRPVERFWETVTLSDLDVLVRESWVFNGYSDAWRTSEHSVQEFIERRKAAGAKAVWVRNNKFGIAANWGIEHTVWPITQVGGREVVEQFLVARGDQPMYYNFEHK